MSDKTTVTIKAFDGAEINLEGDTVISFAIDFDDILNKNIKGNSAYIGEDIPDEMLPEILASLIGDLIEQKLKDNEFGPVYTAFNLYNVSKLLEERHDEIVNSLSIDDLAEAQRKALAKIESLRCK